MPRLLTAAAYLAPLALAACGNRAPDERFATPEATIASLLRAYGVQAMPEAEVQKHMRAQGHFQLRDQVLYRTCFFDYRGPQDEGAAGFVFGTIAARKDNLRVVLVGDRANVFTDPENRPDHMVVLMKTDQGYKISLEQSVPAPVRQRLHEVYKRAIQRNGP